ncbi:B12-binding domain-containing radical SAM protein [Oceanidesulfovibrio indonesiensis]|uniref:B12-binding domain-containing radical SAM protein n=1 Tax=Oceanidesulfovibrio indonesiensis TaxID=54767 RepID=A0A7M3MHE8_9BACT|nr:B12-binding domain-containing radical SAM protein [Oceanidesulfovibrio indonesiensis]TVM18361.1 B12-binding domain-containing radical SAM protein [Oceanidesulfovibrio indonesiensis]
MNVLLVYPRCPETFWSFRSALSYVSRKATLPPLGLLTVAAMLPESWDRRLVDCNVRALDDADIAWADLVFVGGMIVQQESALDVVTRSKAMGKTVVGGGPLFNAMVDHFPEVDHFVLGEGEITVPQFLADLKRGEPKRIYESDTRPDIASVPVPEWRLIDFRDYYTMPLQYSRGCPFNCEFCDIVLLNGRTPRTKAPAQMMAEMQALYDAGWRGGVFIVDDNFIGNKHAVKRFLPELVEWQRSRRYPFTFITEASVNLADDAELMLLMSDANFNKVFLGIETPEESTLQECGKYQNTSRDLAESVRTIQGHGMQVMAGFIVGFDSDTESTFDIQIRFIQNVGVVTAMVGLLNALPYTRLWHRLREEKRLLAETSGDNTDGRMNFIPKMDCEVLLAGYRRIVSEIYSRRSYYRRIGTFLENYSPTARRHWSVRETLAFFRCMVRIGVFSRNRLLYWQLLMKTLRTKVKALPEAVELAILGEHFFRLRERLLREVDFCPTMETSTPQTK